MNATVAPGGPSHRSPSSSEPDKWVLHQVDELLVPEAEPPLQYRASWSPCHRNTVLNADSVWVHVRHKALRGRQTLGDKQVGVGTPPWRGEPTISSTYLHEDTAHLQWAYLALMHHVRAAPVKRVKPTGSNRGCDRREDPQPEDRPRRSPIDPADTHGPDCKSVQGRPGAEARINTPVLSPVRRDRKRLLL